MSQSQSQSQSRSGFDINDGAGRDGPVNELDMYNRAVEPPVDDDFLGSMNLGLGYYSSREYWQQVESFRQGLYADAAFARPLNQRAIEEAKRGMGLEAWNNLDEDEREKKDRRRFIRAKGEERWQGLMPSKTASEYTSQQEREEEAARRRRHAIDNYAETSLGFTPPHWRMIMMRHEASRSRGARLLDNLFGRVREFMGEAAKAAQDQIEQVGGGS